jgi:hypothetical protein
MGGSPITITGSGLTGATTVTIGGVPATNVVVVSPTQLTAVTPPGSIGTFDVTVSGPKNTVTAPGSFSYLPTRVPSWATVLELLPDPAVVTNAALRQAVLDANWAWRVRDNGTNIEMLLLPPGAFTMGCSASVNGPCSPFESPTHAVTLSGAVYMGRYEVTQSQWTARMGVNPSYFFAFGDSGARPVERATLDATAAFLAATGMRLPTEAEWEFGCRAGSTTAFYNESNDDTQVGVIGWFGANSGSATHPVGGKAPNAFGFCDMSGNVWELVSDWAADYPPDPQIDPTGPATGSARLARGGGWNGIPEYLRSSQRVMVVPSSAPSNSIGFRVARNPN